MDQLPYCERCMGPAPLPNFPHCESGDVQVQPSQAKIEAFQIITCSDVMFSQGLYGSEISVRESRVQMLQKAWCGNELSTAIPRVDGFCFKPLVRFCLLPGLDLVVVLCLLQKQRPGSLEELPWCTAKRLVLWQRFPMVFSPGSWRAPPHRKFWLHHYCRAYCLGQGQDLVLLTS